MHRMNAACCHACHTSGGVSVCVGHSSVARTDEPVEMPFGVPTHVGPFKKPRIGLATSAPRDEYDRTILGRR